MLYSHRHGQREQQHQGRRRLKRRPGQRDLPRARRKEIRRGPRRRHHVQVRPAPSDRNALRPPPRKALRRRHAQGRLDGLLPTPHDKRPDGPRREDRAPHGRHLSHDRRRGPQRALPARRRRVGEVPRREGALHRRLAGRLLRLPRLPPRLHPRPAAHDAPCDGMALQDCHAVHGHVEGGRMGARRAARHPRRHQERNRHLLQRRARGRLRHLPLVPPPQPRAQGV